MTRMRDPWDMFADDLDTLPRYDASPERVERIRARCLAALAARRCATLRPPVRRAAWREWLEPALALGLSACLSRRRYRYGAATGRGDAHRVPVVSVRSVWRGECRPSGQASSRRNLKKSCMSLRQSASSTPETTAQWWLTGRSSRRTSERMPPHFGSAAP